MVLHRRSYSGRRGHSHNENPRGTIWPIFSSAEKWEANLFLCRPRNLGLRQILFGRGKMKVKTGGQPPMNPKMIVKVVVDIGMTVF